MTLKLLYIHSPPPPHCHPMFLSSSFQFSHARIFAQLLLDMQCPWCGCASVIRVAFIYGESFHHHTEVPTRLIPFSTFTITKSKYKLPNTGRQPIEIKRDGEHFFYENKILLHFNFNGTRHCVCT